MYSSEGGKRNGFQAIDPASDPMMSLIPPALQYIYSLPVAPKYLYATFDNESVLDYLEIPLMVKYSVKMNGSAKLYINAGPYVGILMNAKQKTSGTSYLYADRDATMPMIVLDEYGQPVLEGGQLYP